MITSWALSRIPQSRPCLVATSLPLPICARAQCCPPLPIATYRCPLLPTPAAHARRLRSPPTPAAHARPLRPRPMPYPPRHRQSNALPPPPPPPPPPAAPSATAPHSPTPKTAASSQQPGTRPAALAFCTCRRHLLNKIAASSAKPHCSPQTHLSGVSFALPSARTPPRTHSPTPHPLVAHPLARTRTPTRLRSLTASWHLVHRCIPCRQRKVRCDMGSVEAPHDPPCLRCRRESKVEPPRPPPIRTVPRRSAPIRADPP